MNMEMKTTIERPRYFPRQVITADDLTLDQDYFREKLRRHNRMLHGWGIVCGCKVEVVPEKPWYVKVNRGSIIGPYGDEICFEKVVCCDLRIKCTSTLVPETSNPCADSVTQVPPAAGTFYLVARYRSDGVRPVRVSASGCGCGENPCENSRWRDGYELCVLDTLPASHIPPAAVATGVPPTLAAGVAPDCPQPPVDEWVLLAIGNLAVDGVVSALDFSKCRTPVHL